MQLSASSVLCVSEHYVTKHTIRQKNISLAEALVSNETSENELVTNFPLQGKNYTPLQLHENSFVGIPHLEYLLSVLYEVPLFALCIYYLFL